MTQPRHTEGATGALRDLLDGIHAGRFIPFNGYSKGYCTSLVEAAEAALAIAEKGGWISVDERLPMHEQEVICTGFEGNDHAKKRWQEFATFHECGLFYGAVFGEQLYPPTHWREMLPTPPAPNQGAAS